MKLKQTLFTAALLIGCGSEPVQIQIAQEFPSFLTIEPSPLQAGKEFTLLYNPLDTTAPYKNPSGLIAGLSFLTLDSAVIISYRLPLVPSAEGLWRARCTVPERAYWCELWIAPPELPPYLRKELRGPVFAGKVPRVGALPTMIESAEDSSKVLALFRLDEQLYPHEHWRWASLWKWSIQYGQGIRQEQIDSLWRIGQNSVSTVAVCLYGFALSRQWHKAAQAGQHLQELLIARPDAEVPYSLLRDLLAHTWVTLPAGNKASEEVAAALSALWNRFPKELDAGSRLSEYHVAPERFYQRNRRHYEAVLEGWVQHFLQAGAASGWEEEIGTAVIVARHLVEWRADTTRALAVLEKAVRFAEELPDEEAPGCGIQVPPVDLPSDRIKWGWTSSLYLEMGRLSLERSPDTAERWLRKVLQLPLKPETRGAIVMACATLARHFLKVRQLDSALKYYAWVYQLGGERRAEALRQELSALIPARSAAQFQNAKLLVQRYPYPQTLHVDIPAIVTEEGELIEPTQTPVPIVLLFSSETCGLCKQWYPQLIREIAAAGLAPRIVVVTPDRSRLQGLPAGVVVSYAPLSFELHRAYQIAGFPTVVVIRGNRVEYQGGLSSRQQLQAIITLLQ